MKRSNPKESILRDEFWNKFSLDKLSPKEWEALCDGCGKCCLHKLEDQETGEIEFTKVSCRLLDSHSCKCGQYETRKQFVPDCVVLSPNNINEVSYWMPQTCAYRLLHEGKPLYSWHPLISGSTDTVHQAGMSVREKCIPEFEVPEEEWEDHIIDEPGV